MPGLLDGVLPLLYSQSNRLKRNFNGLLSDPLGSLEQTAGLLGSNIRGQNALMDAAFTDKSRPFKVTNQNALASLIDNTMNGAMGFAPVGMMAGVGAKSANKAALGAAQDMERRGVKPEAIWQQTGWGKGPDEKWRFEIDDSAAKMTPELRKMPQKETINMEDAFRHDELYKAYPELATTGIHHREFPPAGRDAFASYMEKHNEVAVNNAHQRFKKQGTLAPGILHELQHAAQVKEGFQPGGNLKDGMDAYQRLAGEAEARLVESRMRMNREQRLQSYPWEPTSFRDATGVPLNNLFFRR